MIRAFGRFLRLLLLTTLSAAYTLITRTALYVVTLYLCLYFFLNTTWFRVELARIVSDLLPGTVFLNGLEWSPSFTELTIVEPVIEDGLGRPVIQTRIAEVGFDLMEFVRFGADVLMSNSPPLVIRLTRAHAIDPDVIVEVERDGFTGIGSVFYQRSKPKSGVGTAPRIEIFNARVTRGKVRVEVAGDHSVLAVGAGIEAYGATVISQGGHNWVTGPEMTIESGRIVIGRIRGEAPLVLPWTALTGVDIGWDDGLFTIHEGRLTISGSPVVIGGSVDIRGEGATRLDVGLQATLDSEPLITEIFGVDAEGQVAIRANGPVSWPTIRATFAAARFDMAGYSLGPLATGITMVSDPYRDAIMVDPVVLELDGRPLFLDELVYERRGRSTESAAFRGRLFAPELTTPALLAIGLEPPSTFNGNADLAFRIGAQLDPTLSSGAPFQADLEIAATGSMDSLRVVPIYGSVGVVGRFTARGNRGRPGELEVESGGAYFYWGKDWARLDGSWRVSDARLDLGGAARLGLNRWAGAAGIDDLIGTVRFDRLRVGGPAYAPVVATELSVKEGRYGETRVDRLSASIQMRDGVLHAENLVTNTPIGRLTAHATVGVFRPGRIGLDPDLPLKVSRAELVGLDFAKLPAIVRRRLDVDLSRYGGIASLVATDVSIPLGAAAPLSQLVGHLSGRVLGLEALGERFSSIDVEASARDSRLSVERLDAKTAAGAALSVVGEYRFKTSQVDARVTVAGIDLETFSATRGKGLSGMLAADIAIDGPARDPRFSGRLTAERIGFADVALGDAEIRFSRNAGDHRIALESPRFFPALSLEKGTLSLASGGVPTALALTLGLRDMDLKKVLGTKLSGFNAARIDRGTLGLSLDAKARRPFQLTLDVPDGGSSVELDGRLVVANRGPLSARYDGQVVELERAIIAVGRYALAACGTITPGGDVSLDVAGSLDLADIPSLRKRFAAVRGRVVTHSVAPPGAEGPFAASCLLLPLQLDGLEALGNPTGYITVRDAANAPKFDGAVRLDRVMMKPRGFGKEIAADDGVVVLSERAGRQTLAVSNEVPITGSLDDGAFTLTGEAELPPVRSRTRLEHWLPSKGTVTVDGLDLGYSVQKEYRLVIDPRLTLEFKELYQLTAAEKRALDLGRAQGAPKFVQGQPSLELTGIVQLTEGAYFRTFAALSKAVGRVFEARTVGAVSRDLSRSFPLLDTMRLDIALRGTNFLVQSDFGVGKTDLDTRFDLRAGGTYANPTLVGNVEVVDGTITYNVFKREFDVAQGRLEFDGPFDRPLLDIRAETNIEVRKSGRLSETDELEDYSITVTVGGRVPDYRIAFESKPSLPEVDIQYLILLGRTKQQLAEEGASGGSLQIVSADLSALVTGLVQAPFVDELVVEPTLGGGGRVEAVLRLGRGIRIGVVGRQETTGARSYDARYRHRLLDRLILEASRRSGSETTGERDRYEVQLEYTIPLD